MNLTWTSGVCKRIILRRVDKWRRWLVSVESTKALFCRNSSQEAPSRKSEYYSDDASVLVGGGVLWWQTAVTVKCESLCQAQLQKSKQSRDRTLSTRNTSTLHEWKHNKTKHKQTNRQQEQLSPGSMVDLTLGGNREYRKTCGHILYPTRCRSKKHFDQV